MKHFLHQMKFVKPKDILAIFTFLLALPVSWIYRLKRKNMWLVCERAAEARDNGYWFYKYVIEKHPELDCVYAIKRNSPDYDKVASLGGEIIEFGSFKHWVYYLSADINISSQKEGKPNAAVCYLLEIYGIRKNRRVYLKHGIVKDDLKWHYYNVMKMWLYVCSAKREFEFCKKTFSYPEDSIVLTGLARYDNLSKVEPENKFVLILPTHREWLSRPIRDYQKYDDVFHFENTEYYHYWTSFLKNEKFLQILKTNNMRAVLFLHPNMQKYKQYFQNFNEEIIVSGTCTDDMQSLMKSATAMITDYSSVFFDFAYMKKPILFYQFDYEKFREGHYQEGYFSYENDGFGTVCKTPEELSAAFAKIAENDFRMPEKYLERVEDFFTFTDQNNCERIYNAICKKRVSEG